MRCFLLEIEVSHRAQGLHVVLFVAIAVEALRHEVGAAIFFQQAAGKHVDAGVFGHPVVGVFNSAVILG